MTTQAVDPSVSRTPLPLDATDAASICVLCSHNCGVRLDVEDGRITSVRADERNPITTGYICNKAFSIIGNPESLVSRGLEIMSSTNPGSNLGMIWAVPPESIVLRRLVKPPT